MIAMFTDFGPAGPYAGQMEAVLVRDAPGVPVISLMHDAPAFQPMAAAYLLAALANDFPTDSVFCCVVDPGVGGARKALALQADGRWFVGPDNGLLAIVARRAARSAWHEITWRPERLSASFHARDLFAPVAAMLARGEDVPDRPLPASAVAGNDWPDDLTQVIYVDCFGNAMTGVRADRLSPEDTVGIAGKRLEYARTFSEAGEGEAFWYANAVGMVEIAVNQGNAADRFGLKAGDSRLRLAFHTEKR